MNEQNEQIVEFEVYKTNVGFTIYIRADRNGFNGNWQLSGIPAFNDEQDSFPTRELALMQVEKIRERASILRGLRMI